MPHSQVFLERSAMLDEHPYAMLFHVLNFAWVCFAVYFVIKHTPYAGKKLFFRTLYVTFFIVFFITFIGAMYSISAFGYMLTRFDFLLFMFTGLFALLATLPLMIKLFGNKNASDTHIAHSGIGIKTAAAKVGICGIAYVGVYFIIANLVQWRFEGFRNFYLDTPWGLAAWGGDYSGLPFWLFITVLRGMLNVFFALPLVSMLSKNKRTFIIGLCLMYLAPAVNHIGPSPIFPDAVRIAHLLGMVCTMLMFGILVGNILWARAKKG
jgi:hypothetical protein